MHKIGFTLCCDMFYHSIEVLTESAVKIYNPHLIARHWYELFCSLAENKQIDRLRISSPWWNNYKILRLINSYLRFNLGLSFLPSVVSLKTVANDFLKKLK